MRIALSVVFIILYVAATGQKIEYRQDSLFINSYFVDIHTSKTTLDSLLGAKGRVKTSKDKLMPNPITHKPAILTTNFYSEIGLFFRRYDYDSTKFSVGIKLYHDSDAKFDREEAWKGVFKGQLYIADNYINDKRTMAQLDGLENCRVTYEQLRMGSYTSILGGDIIYGKNIIRLALDYHTTELNAIYIHYKGQ